MTWDIGFAGGFHDSCAGLNIALDITVVNTWNTVIQHVVAKKRDGAFGNLDHDIGRGVGLAVMMDLEGHAAVFERIAVIDGLVGAGDAGTRGFAFGQALQQLDPVLTFTGFDQCDHIGMAVNGGIRVSSPDRLVAQPVVTMNVRVEYGDYRLVRYFCHDA